jgi:tetratricopeptide (TPR) repeat protein
MLVTLPFLLLLLDLWPLRRFDLRGSAAPQATGARRASLRPLGFLIAEKMPLVILAAVCCLVTLRSQWAGLEERIGAISFGDRAANAAIACAAYVMKMFRPVNLAVLYPHPEAHWQTWQLAGACVMLAAVSVVVWWNRSRPHLVVGWLWYLGLLLPVIGLLQVGKQAMADRYTYLPQIGLYVLLAWTIHDVCRRWPRGERVCWIGSGLLATGLLGGAMHQTGYWRDSETLWTHTIACTAPNAAAHYDLGVFLDGRGRTKEAVDHFLQALRIDPQDYRACNNLGIASFRQGRIDKAIEYYRRGLVIRPCDASLHTNLGAALLAQGQLDQALEQHWKAVACDPADAKAQYNLGVALLRQGRALTAVDHYREALKINPAYVNAETGMGVALRQLGRVPEALDHLRKSLRRQPDAVAVLKLTAGILATDPKASVRNGAEALELAQRAARITRGRDAGVLNVLAAAYAETGQFAKALQVAQRSLALATAENNPALAKAVRAKIDLYQAGVPYRAR